jgi:hypothetical protein
MYPKKRTTTKMRVTLWDERIDDTYVRSIGGISTEWDDWYSTQEYARKLVNVRGMI